MSDSLFCCDHMRRYVADGVVKYDDRFDELGLIVKDDGEVQIVQQLFYCPWSGDKLRPSQRSRWFDELEAKGVDPMNDPIPEPYRTAAWRE